MGGITEVLAKESLALDFQLLHCRKMFSSWDKVRNFLDTMDISDIHSPLPFSSTSSSSSSSDPSSHPISVSAKSWLVGEKTTRQILSVIQPTAESELKRKDIVKYLQGLIGNSFGIEVFPFGSVPLKTYLPHGDVDLTAVGHYENVEDLATRIRTLLENEEKNNASIEVRHVLSVPAQVRVVKCTVDDIAVDISFNQTAGLCALYLLEQVDQYIGRDHLFKRSVILVKAWCFYESRLLGGLHGLISTYALEIMVLHVMNLFHSSLHCPLGVLFKFLEYYSTFDWRTYCIGINGLVVISSLPKIEVISPRGCDDLLLTEEFLRSFREALLPFTGVAGTIPHPFPVKHLNILDPLRDDNNLGRSVSKGNFYRIKSALSFGALSLGEILILPLEKIGAGVEKFFSNTLKRNGKGRRADVIVPVPVFGFEDSEISAANNSDDLLTGIPYGLWFDDYNLQYSGQLSSQATHQVWYNRWGGMSYFDHNSFGNLEESPPSSVGSPGGFRQIQAASFEDKCKTKGKLSSDTPRGLWQSREKREFTASSAEEKWKPAGEKWKSRGKPSLFGTATDFRVHVAAAEEKWKSKATRSFVDSPKGLRLGRAATVEEKWSSGGVYACVPLPGQLVQGNMTLKNDGEKWARSREEQWKEEETEKELGCMDSQVCTPTESKPCSDVGESRPALHFTMDEFPLLPGSKPIPMSVPLAFQNKQIKETSVSGDDTEFLSLKPLSPTSLSPSEAGKQTESDGSATLDSLTGPTVAVEEDQELSGSEGTLVASVEPLQLADENEFPPLGRQADPVKPVIKLNKKEFPTLSASLKSQKKNKRKNSPKEVKNRV